MKNAWRRSFSQVLQAAIRKQAAPGFQCIVGWKDKTLGVFCEGVEDFKHHRAVRPNTWFDLASLTKILCTVDLLMMARQSGKFTSLDANLRPWFPFFKSELRHRTLQELLTHRAGLEAIFRDSERSEAQLPTRADRLHYFLRRMDETYDARGVGREVYSDIGFMILGSLLEQMAGRNLSHQFKWAELSFNPSVPRLGGLGIFFGGRSIASELTLEKDQAQLPWLTGTVQDPRAQWLMGEAGHAGLFGTGQGVEWWAQEFYRAYWGKSGRLSDKVAREFVDFESLYKARMVEPRRFLNGFDTPDNSGSQAGRYFGSETIGHLGYSGASFWMDLATGARVILLCHRFQPGLEPDTLRRMRPEIHNWLHENVFFKLKDSLSWEL